MSLQVYEGLFILDSNRYARDHSGVSGQVDELIKAAGGEILVSRFWEERRLAYPIQGQRKGSYWLTYFRMESKNVDALTRQCEINDAILRQLFVRVDPRLVDTLVSHASSEAAHKPQGETTKKDRDGKSDGHRERSRPLDVEIALAAVGEFDEE